MPDNPSVSLRLTAPFAQGSLWDGDADCRVASLLAMTVLNLCHSEEAQRADVGIRPFYDGRGFGPPYLGHGLRRPNFVPKFGASVKSSVPTEGLPESQQRADVGIGPYGTKGRPHRPPWPVAQGGASAPAVARGGWDMQQRASPKCPATSGNPSVALRATAPFAQGSLALRGGTLPPPGFQRLMDAALESVGADLRVGPWAGPAKRRVRADT